MNRVIDVDHLSKSFGTVQAVDGLTFSVTPGEIFGIIGPDGAGKTTALRILAGVMLPSAGTVRVLGMSLPQEAEGVKEHIGYMSQKFNLYPDLTVDENIRFFSDIFLIDPATLARRIEPLLAMTRMAPFRARRAGDLSGGMKQKLALMCTLIHRPRLLLLDEPTTGVDPVSRREFWELLHEILLEGVTIVLSTPYMDEAEWCSRIGLMFKGQMLSVDTPKRLKQDLEGLVIEIDPRAGVSDISSRLRLRDEIRDIQVFGKRYHAVVKEEGDVERLRKDLGETATVRRIPPSIEDVFVNRIRA